MLRRAGAARRRCGAAAYDAIDLLEREGGGRLPLLRAAQDQVVERVADAVVLAVERVCREWGTLRLEYGRAQRAGGRGGAPGKWYVAAWCSE